MLKNMFVFFVVVCFTSAQLMGAYSEADVSYANLSSASGGLKADFDLSLEEACVGQIVHLIDDSEEADSVKWVITPGSFTFVNGTNENSWSPYIQINDTGTYTVTQFVYNSTGVDMETQEIFAGPFEIGIQTMDSTNYYCGGDSVTFIAEGDTFFEFYVDGVLMQADSLDIFGLVIDSTTTVSVRSKINDSCFTDYDSITIFVSYLRDTVLQVNHVSCSGTNDGYIKIAGLDGAEPLTYTWGDGATGAERTQLAAGTYDYTITDSAGCMASGSVTLTGSGSMQINSNIVDVSCFGEMDGSATIQAGGGTSPYAYNWQTGATTNQITGVAAGTYHFTVTDDAGCFLIDSIEIAQPNPLEISMQTTNLTCAGNSNGSIALTASGGTGPYGFNWSTGSTSNPIAGLAAGVYQFTVTDDAGCVLMDSAEITQPDPLEITTEVDDVTCAGAEDGNASVLPEGGTGPYSITWQSGATTTSVGNLAGGTYAFTVTDDQGCVLTDSINIEEPGLLTVMIEETVAIPCQGGEGLLSAVATGGTGTWQYQWSNGGNTQAITVQSSGSYVVTVSDDNNCEAVDSIQLNLSTGLELNITATNFLCPGSNGGFAAAAVTGGTGPYEYLWSNGQFTDTIFNLNSGTYIITVTDQNGCSNIDSTVIESSQDLIIEQVTISPVTCLGAINGTIEIQASGGQQGYSYVWNNGIEEPLISGIGAGSYTVTVTDGLGCAVDTTIIMDAPELLEISGLTLAHPLCHGANTGTALVEMQGGTGPLEYTWSTGQQANFIDGLAAGEYDVTVTDSMGCSTDTSFTINEPEELEYDLLAIKYKVCPNEEDGLIEVAGNGGTPGYSYSWSNSVNDSLNDGLGAGTYVLHLKDANQCSLTDTFEIISFEQQSMTIENPAGDTTICDGETILIEAESGYHIYEWNTGETTPSITVQEPGQYWVKSIDPNGCDITSDTIEVTTLPLPATSPISGPDTVHLNAVENYAVSSHTGSTYDWEVDTGSITNGQGSPGISVHWTQLGWQEIELVETGANGCKGDTVNMRVWVQQPSGFNPNAFPRVRLYPNPSDGRFRLDGLEPGTEVLVTDVLGRQLSAVRTAGVVHQFDLAEAGMGMYLVTLRMGRQRQVFKVVVQ